jgi:hypothetical protein
VTPLDLTLKEETYNVKITKDDYEDYATSITIRAGETETINAELKETIKTGTLTIDSEPSEADIYIDGKYRGITPLTLTLEVGSYNIEVSKGGYENYTKTITITDRETKVITPKLEKIITNGTLHISSNPSNASVAIVTEKDAINYKNGGELHPIKLENTTPISISLQPGEYYIIVSKENYESCVKFVTIKDGKTTHVNVDLEKKQAGTYDNPAKVGEPIKVINRQGEYTVTVIEYVRGERADYLVEKANPYNYKPKFGHEYLLVKVWALYRSSSTYAGVPISELDFSVVSYDGSVYSPVFIVYPDGYPEFEYGHLSSDNDEMEGWIAFEVPKDDENVLLVYSDSWSSYYFII